MKRQHIVVAYLKKSKRSDADGTGTPVPFSAYTALLSAYKVVKVYADNYIAERFSF